MLVPSFTTRVCCKTVVLLGCWRRCCCCRLNAGLIGWPNLTNLGDEENVGNRLNPLRIPPPRVCKRNERVFYDGSKKYAKIRN